MTPEEKLDLLQDRIDKEAAKLEPILDAYKDGKGGNAATIANACMKSLYEIMALGEQLKID